MNQLAMHALLIDDDPIGLYLTERLLKREGLFETVTSFQSPVEALAFLQHQTAASLVPQVIFLDINMPLLDGWRLLEALKPHEVQLQSQCSLYLLTSSLAPSDMVRAKEHPLVTQLICKPLDSSKIQEIHKHVERNRNHLPVDLG